MRIVRVRALDLVAVNCFDTVLPIMTTGLVGASLHYKPNLLCLVDKSYWWRMALDFGFKEWQGGRYLINHQLVVNDNNGKLTFRNGYCVEPGQARQKSEIKEESL